MISLVHPTHPVAGLLCHHQIVGIGFDCITTDVRPAGVFFGMWRFASKRVRPPLATRLVLDLIGFAPTKIQCEEVRRALCLLCGPGVDLFFLNAAVLLSRYRFTDSKQRQVQTNLRAAQHGKIGETRVGRLATLPEGSVIEPSN